MKIQRLRRKAIALVGLVTAASGCSSVLNSNPEISTSIEFEPPAAWESAVAFSFADSTRFPQYPFAARVELEMDGYRPRVITGRDLFTAPSGAIVTPWYRVPLGRATARTLTFRVVVTDTSGVESVADYPLEVKRDHFYQVNFGVGTRRPPRPEAPPLTEGWRWYPVAPTARVQPTDSLLITYMFRTRDCFNCVF